MTATQGLHGGILKILNLSEILPVYFLDRLLHLSAVVSVLHIWWGSRGPWKINCCTWKISSGELRNSANWSAEFEKFPAQECRP